MVVCNDEFDFGDIACPNCQGKGIRTEFVFVKDNAPHDELEYKGLGVFTCPMCKGKKRLPIIDMRDLK